MSLSGRAGAKTVLVEADDAALPFGVVAAKIRPPLLRPGAVSRTALVNRLRAGRSARAVSVVAPGGYGKTTLLAQWAARDDRPFAWVSLDRRDNDPVVLLRQVAAAINEIRPVDPRLLDALGAPDASVWTSVLPRVAALVATADEIHQSFVPSRGPSQFDVMLDIAGAAVAVSAIRVKMLLSVS